MSKVNNVVPPVVPPTERNWRPSRKGPIYCAPACGGRCTWAQYQDAKKRAKALVATLGEGWEPEVWENLGWFFTAGHTSGHLNVNAHQHGDKFSYTAMLQIGDQQFIASGPLPKAVVARVIHLAKAHVAMIQNILKLVEPWR